MILSDRSLREAIAAGRLVIDPLDDDAIRQRQAEGSGEGVRVLDVAQVLEESIQAGERPPPSS